jgi:hypothetical protein
LSEPLSGRWLPLVGLGLALLASVILYLHPRVGAWPLGLIGVAWLIRLRANGRLSRTTPLDLPLAVFAFSALVAAGVAFNQESEWARGAEWSAYHTPLNWAWGKFYFILTALGLYYAIANLQDVDQVWRVMRFYPCFGAAVGLYFTLTNDWSQGGTKFDALAQLGSAITEPLPEIRTHRLMPNVAGGLVAWTLPYFVPVVRQAGQRALWLWAILAIVSLTALLLSASRGAWTALIVVGVIWLTAAAAPSARNALTTPRRRHSQSIWFGALFLLAGSVLLLGWLASSIPGDLFRLTSSATSGPFVGRADLFKSSWLLAQDYLFTGGGLGAFPMLYSTYYLLISVLFLPHSHNLFLDILIEQGVLGLLSYLWLLGAFLMLVFRGLASQVADEGPETATSQPPVGDVLAASLASVGVMALHGLVDDVPYGSRALLLMFVPLAFAVAVVPAGGRTTKIPATMLVAAVGLVGLAMLWQRPAVLGGWYANLGALEEAQRELGGYHWPDQLPEHVRKERDLADVQSKLREALLHDPSQRTANQRLGTIALGQGRAAEARDYLLTAAEAEPDNPTGWRLLAESYLALGEREEACRIEAKAVAGGWAGPWRFGGRLCS